MVNNSQSPEIVTEALSPLDKMIAFIAFNAGPDRNTSIQRHHSESVKYPELELDIAALEALPLPRHSQAGRQPDPLRLMTTVTLLLSCIVDCGVIVSGE